MAEYERSNARVFNDVILKRSFYNNGSLYDPYGIDKIEIWKGSYDPEVPELLKDTIYGSQMIIYDIVNDAYDELGLVAGAETVLIVGVLAYEQSFVNETDFLITHNLTDRYPNVIVYDDSVNPEVIKPDNIISIDENTIRLTFSIPQSGTVKIYGTEEFCSRTQYTISKYEQVVAGSSNVTVTHNLNDDDPRVVVYDENYNFIFPDTITVLNNDQVQVTFASPLYGVIFVMGGVAGYRTTGFGFQPTARGTNEGPFVIMTGVNDQLNLEVDGSTEIITLPPSPNSSVDDIVGTINSQWTLGVADKYEGTVRLRSNFYGAAHNLIVKNPPNNAADDLGITITTYNGMGQEPAYVIGSQTGPFTITAGLNDTIKISVNYDDPIIITLNPGLNTITNIVNSINGDLATANYNALASDDGGRLRIDATAIDGIERESIGTYKITYLVPGSFISEGVLHNFYQDVWHYAPNISYMQAIVSGTSCCGTVFVPDNTCCFIVYPENYFTDCGFADYKYTFNLANKQLNNGEIRDMVINVEPIPRYETPDKVLYVLPITEAEYYIATYGGNQVVDWTPVDLNRGFDLKTRIDTTGWQDGSYKMRIKMNLPQGEIIISDWMRFNVLGPCTI